MSRVAVKRVALHASMLVGGLAIGAGLAFGATALILTEVIRITLIGG